MIEREHVYSLSILEVCKKMIKDDEVRDRLHKKLFHLELISDFGRDPIIVVYYLMLDVLKPASGHTFNAYNLKLYNYY